jgi:hypothetical protein
MLKTDPTTAQRTDKMLPDDVFRERLEKTLVDLEAWAKTIRDCADAEVDASQRHWRMSVVPYIPGACPFELLIKADQTFSLNLAGEFYEDRPLDRFDFFIKLVDAIAAGRVDRVETYSAPTGMLLGIAMRVAIEDGWDWIGSREVTRHRMPLLESEIERRTRRYLSYLR